MASLRSRFSAEVRGGWQVINWGESTALVINSLNQANPVNANNLFRVGFDLTQPVETPPPAWGS